MSSYISLPMYAASLDARLRLQGGLCRACSAIAYPPREHCLECNAGVFDTVTLKGTGSIYSFTVIAPGGAPAEFDQQQAMTGVISVAIIQLDEGPRVIGQLSDANPGELHIGMRVRAVARRLYDQEGIVRYGVKFSPVPAHLNVENQNGPG
jgi:uncharacterized OB-fold protein